MGSIGIQTAGQKNEMLRFGLRYQETCKKKGKTNRSKVIFEPSIARFPDKYSNHYTTKIH